MIYYHDHRKRKASHKEYNELIKKLSVYNLSIQMCLLTQKAIDYVKQFYINTIEV